MQICKGPRKLFTFVVVFRGLARSIACTILCRSSTVLHGGTISVLMPTDFFDLSPWHLHSRASCLLSLSLETISVLQMGLPRMIGWQVLHKVFSDSDSRFPFVLLFTMYLVCFRKFWTLLWCGLKHLNCFLEHSAMIFHFTGNTHSRCVVETLMMHGKSRHKLYRASWLHCQSSVLRTERRYTYRDNGRTVLWLQIFSHNESRIIVQKWRGVNPLCLSCSSHLFAWDPATTKRIRPCRSAASIGSSHSTILLYIWAHYTGFPFLLRNGDA